MNISKSTNRFWHYLAPLEIGTIVKVKGIHHKKGFFIGEIVSYIREKKGKVISYEVNDIKWRTQSNYKYSWYVKPHRILRVMIGDKIQGLENLLKRGNRKLSFDIGVWTMSRDTCIGAGVCKTYCYAKKMNFPNVLISRTRKYEQAQQMNFRANMIKEIKRRQFKYIRVHEAGDFFAPYYFEKWLEIASACPESIFFAFTKSFANFDMYRYLIPKNFILIQSYGSSNDKRIHPSENTAHVIEKNEQPKLGEYLCPYGSSTWTKTDKCGTTCKYCMTPNTTIHVAFHKH